MRTGILWNPWQELDNFRREVSAMLNGGPRWGNDWAEGPSFNVYSGENGVILTAELPGFDPDAFDISVQGDTVTVRGKRGDETAENVRYHLRERGAVEFEKSFRLPFPVDADKTEAAYERGVLTVKLHRPEEQKPRKIGVRTA
ncbi:MAG TPA: Hsp20/alpha crystallin family protein [Planctomycetaceae bacterium]